MWQKRRNRAASRNQECEESLGKYKTNNILGDNRCIGSTCHVRGGHFYVATLNSFRDSIGDFLETLVGRGTYPRALWDPDRVRPEKTVV